MQKVALDHVLIGLTDQGRPLMKRKTPLLHTVLLFFATLLAPASEAVEITDPVERI